MVDRKLVAAGLVAALLLFAGCSGTSGANTEEGTAAGASTVDEETMTEMEEATEEPTSMETTEEETMTEMDETTEETSNETMENETVGNETMENETVGNETMENETVGNETTDNETSA